MKCPIILPIGTRCDLDINPMNFRTHIWNEHDSLGFDISILMMLAEILQKLKEKELEKK